MAFSTENIDVLIDEYRKCVEICSNTDYGDPSSVKKHNKSVNKMDSIVDNITSQGPKAIDRLSILLDEDNTGTWLAFQLLDSVKITPAIEKKCLSLIRKQASGQGTDALGAKYWLKEWKHKNRKSKFHFLRALFK